MQWYLGITGCDTCFVAVLLGGQDFRIYAVKRNDELIKALQEKCYDFWQNNVQGRVPPEPQNIKEVLKLFPQDNSEMVEATNEQAADIGEYKTLNEKIKNLKSQLETVKSRLIVELKDKCGFTIAGMKACTYKTQPDNRLDSTKLKEEAPDIYQKYLNCGTKRVFKTF